MRPASAFAVLRELEKNMDGYQNSVKAVMRAAGARRLRGIIGPVSAILKVEPAVKWLWKRLWAVRCRTLW